VLGNLVGLLKLKLTYVHNMLIVWYSTDCGIQGKTRIVHTVGRNIQWQ